MRARISEKVVQAQIVTCLHTAGARVYVLGHPAPNDGRRHRGTGQTPGLPDLLAFVPVGEDETRNWTLLWIEVKAKGGRLRPEQMLFRAQCHDAGVEHLVGDLDVVIAWLMRVGLLVANNVPHYRLPKEA